MKYDEKFIYFYAEQAGYDPETDTLYIPIDTTPKSGSTYCENYGITFDRPCDFVIRINGRDNSRVVVQERYEVMRAMFMHETEDEDAYLDVPDPDSPAFRYIDLMLQTATPLLTGNWQASSEVYETGKLLYGNANPEDSSFNSLADFCFTENGVEIRIPWQLLNFGNPSEMMIHDDYYEHYGVEFISVDEMYVGVALEGASQGRIRMASFPLEGWGKEVTSHERLKQSYYMLKEYWAAS